MVVFVHSLSLSLSLSVWLRTHQFPSMSDNKKRRRPRASAKDAIGTKKLCFSEVGTEDITAHV
jgi:hypothetical protein